MNWNDLLSGERLGEAIEMPYKNTKIKFDISEFEKDYWRIMNCSAFRRLQDKTQVFPLDKNDFVRTRLTHSLEVAAIAKELVSMVYYRLKDTDKFPFTEKNAKDAADIASCAGLLHDIGNPPFGHFGEDVMKAWFENNYKELGYLDKDDVEIKLSKEEIIADLRNFEGNAQAFRLLTKLHDVDSEYGLNLTAAVLSTIVKYPTDSLHIRSKSAAKKEGVSDDICLHKLGYYHADQDHFKRVAEITGTYFDGEYHRHPLTFIL